MPISTVGPGCRTRYVKPETHSGFTLVEMIIVMLIVGMMAAIIAPRVKSGIDTMLFRTSLKKMVSTLRYSRSMAISGKKNKEVEMDLDAQTYRVLDGNLPADEENGGPPGGTFPDKVIFTEWETSYDTDNSGTHILTFFPKGNTTGGTLRIEDHNGRIYEIIVDRITGRVKVKMQDG